jgi:hypothetical protein
LPLSHGPPPTPFPHASALGSGSGCAACLAAALADRPVEWAALRRLELRGHPCGLDALAQLLISLPNLEALAFERRWAPLDALALRGLGPRLARGARGRSRLRVLELGGSGALLDLPVASLAPELESLEVWGLECDALRLEAEVVPSLQSVTLRAMPALARLGLPARNGLTALELRGVPRLRHLVPLGPGEWAAALDQLRRLPRLERLCLEGARLDARLPPAVSALTALTRLEASLRWAAGATAGPNADSAPLWTTAGGGGQQPAAELRRRVGGALAAARRRACPLAGCVSLRELVLRDLGPGLEVPGEALLQLPRLEVRWRGESLARLRCRT